MVLKLYTGNWGLGTKPQEFKHPFTGLDPITPLTTLGGTCIGFRC